MKLEYEEQKLKSLKQLFEEEFDSFINAFEKDIKKKCNKMEALCHKKKYDELEKVAHTLKGTSITLGCHFTHEIALKLEEQIKSKEIDSILESISEIRKKLEI